MQETRATTRARAKHRIRDLKVLIVAVVLCIAMATPAVAGTSYVGQSVTFSTGYTASEISGYTNTTTNNENRNYSDMTPGSTVTTYTQPEWVQRIIDQETVTTKEYGNPELVKQIWELVREYYEGQEGTPSQVAPDWYTEPDPLDTTTRPGPGTDLSTLPTGSDPVVTVDQLPDLSDYDPTVDTSYLDDKKKETDLSEYGIDPDKLNDILDDIAKARGELEEEYNKKIEDINKEIQNSQDEQKKAEEDRASYYENYDSVRQRQEDKRDAEDARNQDVIDKITQENIDNADPSIEGSEAYENDRRRDQLYDENEEKSRQWNDEIQDELAEQQKNNKNTLPTPADLGYEPLAPSEGGLPNFDFGLPSTDYFTRTFSYTTGFGYDYLYIGDERIVEKWNDEDAFYGQILSPEEAYNALMSGEITLEHGSVSPLNKDDPNGLGELNALAEQMSGSGDLNALAEKMLNGNTETEKESGTEAPAAEQEPTDNAPDNGFEALGEYAYEYLYEKPNDLLNDAVDAVGTWGYDVNTGLRNKYGYTIYATLASEYTEDEPNQDLQVVRDLLSSYGNVNFAIVATSDDPRDPVYHTNMRIGIMTNSADGKIELTRFQDAYLFMANGALESPAAAVVGAGSKYLDLLSGYEKELEEEGHEWGILEALWGSFISLFGGGDEDTLTIAKYVEGFNDYGNQVMEYGVESTSKTLSVPFITPSGAELDLSADILNLLNITDLDAIAGIGEYGGLLLDLDKSPKEWKYKVVPEGYEDTRNTGPGIEDVEAPEDRSVHYYVELTREAQEEIENDIQDKRDTYTQKKQDADAEYEAAAQEAQTQYEDAVNELKNQYEDLINNASTEDEKQRLTQELEDKIAEQETTRDDKIQAADDARNDELEKAKEEYNKKLQELQDRIVTEQMKVIEAGDWDPKEIFEKSKTDGNGGNGLTDVTDPYSRVNGYTLDGTDGYPGGWNEYLRMREEYLNDPGNYPSEYPEYLQQWESYLTEGEKIEITSGPKIVHYTDHKVEKIQGTDRQVKIPLAFGDGGYYQWDITYNNVPGSARNGTTLGYSSGQNLGTSNFLNVTFTEPGTYTITAYRNIAVETITAYRYIDTEYTYLQMSDGTMIPIYIKETTGRLGEDGKNQVFYDYTYTTGTMTPHMQWTQTVLEADNQFRYPLNEIDSDTLRTK